MVSRIKNELWLLFLIGCIIHDVVGELHSGESLFLPDERTSLDDCHLRYYQFDRGGGGGIGGIPATQFEFAHMGAIGWIQSEDGKILWQCGGSLIWENFVLTAAHCVVDSSNTPPNVVRFGDLDIFSTVGDEFAQQIKIAEIIRHPSHRFAGHYHDVALLRLEKSVIITNAVIPACLWLDNEVWFKRIHATGWGNVGFIGNQSAVLLKMELDPISLEECGKVYNNGTTRKLGRGLADHHICAFHPVADTCEGDSGGPLQVKLVHNMRQTPFIIGVTSFGLICGTSTPGVYTRVASYHQWIINTMRDRGAAVDENTFNSTTCVHRYVEHREFYEGVVAHRGGNGSVELNVFNYMFSWNYGKPRELVKLRWPKGRSQSNCYGVVVDEDTVLTVADCVESNGIPVDHIEVEPTTIVKISKVLIHPSYRKGSSYNNIAVLKLGSLLDFQDGTYPTCIWSEQKWPFGDALVLGEGRRDLVTAIYPSGSFEIDPSYGFVRLRSVIRNSTSCMIGDREQSKVKNGIPQELVCAGYDFYIVPEMCNLVVGAGLKRTMTRVEREYTFTMALSQFGRDCGVGEHMIATRLASHAEWLKSILLPKPQNPGSNVQFLDSDLRERDICEVNENTPGKCVQVSECLNYWENVVPRGGATFCSSSNVICCPATLTASQIFRNRETELERCPSLLRGLKSPIENGSLVQIGFDTKDWYDFRCVGSIITKQLILATASCFGDEVPLVVRLSVNETIVPIKSIVKHKQYNVTDKSNDVALIQLASPLTWNAYVFPTCLWMNQTHTPLVMRLIELDGVSFSTKFVIPQYNTDCQRAHPYRLQRTQLCVREPYFAKTCAKAGDVLRSEREGGVSYVVGLAQSSENCDTRTYITLTRISQQLEWIKRALDEDFWVV